MKIKTKGFSLPEVAISIVLLNITIIVLVNMISMALMSAYRAYDDKFQLDIAEGSLEELSTSTYEALATYNGQGWQNYSTQTIDGKTYLAEFYVTKYGTSGREYVEFSVRSYKQGDVEGAITIKSAKSK